MINGQHIKNSAQIPNVLYDVWDKYLTGNELKMLRVIERKTFGFNKTRDSIGISQFAQQSGIDERHCRRYIKSLVEKGLVKRYSTTGGDKNNCSEYEIDLTALPRVANKAGVPNTPRGAKSAFHGGQNQHSTGGKVAPHKTHISKPISQNTETPRAPADDIDTGQLRELIDEYSDKVCRVDTLALDYRLREAIAHSGLETVERCLRAVIQAADDPAYPRDKLPRSLTALLRDVERVDAWARRYVEPDDVSTGPPVNGQALWDAKTVEWLKGLTDAEREYQFSEAHRLRQLWPEEVYRLWPQSRPRQTAQTA